MSHRRPVVAIALLASFSGVGFAACTRAPTDQFVAGLTTQVQVPRDLQSVVIRISKANSNIFCKAYPVIDGVARLPQSLGTALPVDSERNIPLEIRVLGIEATPDSDQGLFSDDCAPIEFGRGKARVLRRIVEQYQDSRKLYIPMPLMYSCFDVKCAGERDTCKGGTCVPAKESPVGKLREYVKEQELGKDNLCFRISAKDGVPGCMDAQVPPKVIDAATCLYELQDVPGVPFVGVNVSTTYEGGYVTEVLDAEAEEGFFIPDAAKPKQFKLAPGICAKVLAEAGSDAVPHTISAVRASGLCPSKTQNQAICAADSIAQTGGDPSGITGPGVVLKATKSALVVLIDNTKNNQSLFDDKGFAQAIVNIGLEVPELRSVAMAPLQIPQATVCATTPTPLNFSDGPSSVRSEFLKLLTTGATSNLTSLGLDAVMQSVYTQVLAVPGADRRAVVVLGNSSFATACAKTPPPDAAATNLGKGVSTYVILTGDKSTADKSGAKDLAIAGRNGGSASEAFGNTSGAAASGLEAFANIAAELTTCRYTAPATLKNSQKVAYFDAKLQREVTVSNVATCGAGAGWANSSGIIQLCGSTCEDLRTSIKQTLVSSLLASTQLNATPIYLRESK